MSTSSRTRLPVARSIIFGVVLLAAAAIIIAWMDVAGYDETILKIIQRF